MRYTVVILQLLVASGCAAAAAPTGGGSGAQAPVVPTARPRHKLVSEREEVRGPSTPALQALQGKVPIVHAIHRPWWEDEDLSEAQFEIAVFEDGTVAYEGDLCAKTGGLVVTHLDSVALSSLREFVAKSCAGLAVQPDDQYCSHGGLVRVTCSGARGPVRGEDRCGGHYDPGGSLRALAKDLVEEVGIGRACAVAVKGVAPGEITRTLQPERTRIWRYVPR